MDKNQFEAIVKWAERGAEAEQQIRGEGKGPFANVLEGLGGFGTPADTAEKRDEYVARTVYAAGAMAEQIAMFAQFGMADQKAKADMMAYSGIALALELAHKVAAAGLNIEIAG